MEPTKEIHMRAAGTKGAFINKRGVIDSGAFMSVVDHETGKVMGFHRQAGERKYTYKTDTGEGGYLKRDMELGIGHHRPILAPVAWMHARSSATGGTQSTDPLIGRRGVFKHYAVTFSGGDGKVHFKRTI
eukprot:TRINITY_DN34369_c0_g1_i1.p1 TRINITY_DN34369_c0_g1~~TRINITY_DN34369_c0_g1_i1.p1  ORF type:complete len:130 (+),score=20.75 TRINITY_DN34369_c0_g1_i1:58-447(+)